MRCANCLDTGHVCENHPDQPWTTSGNEDHCGGAGMPCQECCSDIPEDGTMFIGIAFMPDWKRPHD